MADCLSLLRKTCLFYDLSDEVLQQHILPHNLKNQRAITKLPLSACWKCQKTIRTRSSLALPTPI